MADKEHGGLLPPAKPRWFASRRQRPLAFLLAHLTVWRCVVLCTLIPTALVFQHLASPLPLAYPHFNAYHDQRLSPRLMDRLRPLDTDRMIVLQATVSPVEDNDWNFWPQMEAGVKWHDVRRPAVWAPRWASRLLPRRMPRLFGTAVQQQQHPGWQFGELELMAAWRVPIAVTPRVLDLPGSAPAVDRIIFAITTTSERALEMLPLWQGWLAPSLADGGKQPMCLIMLGPTETQSSVQALRQGLGEHRIDCGIVRSDERRYELRVLAMMSEVGNYVDNLPFSRLAEWVIWCDDDTIWMDLRALRRALSKYDPNEDHFIGSHSESGIQAHDFGAIAFGGAGLHVSRGLYKALQRVAESGGCKEKFGHMYGGDGMISFCVGLLRGKNGTEVVEVEPGLHQWDVPADVTGLLQSGLPILNLHHFQVPNWVHPLGFGHPLSAKWPLTDKIDISMLPAQVKLLTKASAFLGGDNFLRRYVFEGGHVLFTLGHSITIYTVPLQPSEMDAPEHTFHWPFPVVWPTRPLRWERWAPTGWRTEGENPEQERAFGSKQTFLIEDIEVLAPGIALMTYIEVLRADEKLSDAGYPAVSDRVRLRVLYDDCWDVRRRTPSCNSPQDGREIQHWSQAERMAIGRLEDQTKE